MKAPKWGYGAPYRPLAKFFFVVVLDRALYFDYIGNMEINRAITALASLAQETRLAVFRLLVKAGPLGLAAGDIAEALEVPAPTLSFHLRHLTHAGLLESRRESRSIIYSVNFQSMQALLAFLTEDCCQGMAGACGDACAPPSQNATTAR